MDGLFHNTSSAAEKEIWKLAADIECDNLKWSPLLDKQLLGLLLDWCCKYQHIKLSGFGECLPGDLPPYGKKHRWPKLSRICVLLDRPTGICRQVRGRKTECGVISLWSCHQWCLLQGKTLCFATKNQGFSMWVCEMLHSWLGELFCGHCDSYWTFMGIFNISFMACSPMFGGTDTCFFWSFQHQRTSLVLDSDFLFCTSQLFGTLFWIPFSLRAICFFVWSHLLMYEDFICLLGSAFLTSLPFTFLFAVWLWKGCGGLNTV